MRAARFAPLVLLLAFAACGTPRDEAGEIAESPPLCALAGMESLGDFDRVPPQVATDLLSRFADVPTTESAARRDLALAPRDGFFNGSGTRSSLLPNRRFAQAARAARDVIVIYEHGGGPHIHVVLYRADETGVFHALANVITERKVMCDTAARLLANPRDPALWYSRIDW